jgi:hypothetical protein
MMDFSHLTPKEKIQLLSKVQDLMDNKDGVAKTIVEEYGAVVWGIIEDALQRTTDTILGSKDDHNLQQLNQKTESLVMNLEKLENSPILQILNQLKAKLETPLQTSPATSQSSGPLTVNPQNPPQTLDSQNLTEEEKQNIINQRFSPRSRGINLGGL